MMINLLKDRFQLAFDMAERFVINYHLIIAKGGSHLRDAAPADGSQMISPPAGIGVVWPKERGCCCY